MYKYKQIVAKAESIKKNVKEHQKLGEYTSWGYFIAKEILKPKTNIDLVKIKSPADGKETAISRQIFKSSYIDLAERYTKYIEKNDQTPAYAKFTTQKGKIYYIGYKPLIDMFSRILVYYDDNGTYPKYANINSKAFIAPTETGNAIYDYFTKKTGKKFKYLDDFLEYVRQRYSYEFYYDDHKSNKQVIDSEAGNCTDLLQLCCNMAKAMGYECRAIHVKCRVSGTGHVRGQFKHPKNTGGQWIDRDPAAVANGESITSIWCSDGEVLAYNPAWFMQNLNR